MDLTLKLDTRGRLTLPEELLNRWGVRAGDVVAVRLEAGTLRATPRRALVSSLVGRYRRSSAPTLPAVGAPTMVAIGDRGAVADETGSGVGDGA